MRIEFSTRAWLLSAATGLVILPSMDVEVRAESPAADASAGEPRMLIERPATREAISTSKPARGLFPNLFSSKKAEPTVQLPPREPGDTRSEVQRHLDALYGRDGRDAPSLDIGQPQNSGLSQTVKQLPQTSAAQASESAPIRQVSSNPFKRFFRRSLRSVERRIRMTNVRNELSLCQHPLVVSSCGFSRRPLLSRPPGRSQICNRRLFQ